MNIHRKYKVRLGVRENSIDDINAGEKALDMDLRDIEIKLNIKGNKYYYI